MHPKIPGGTVLNLSRPNLLGTIKKLTLKIDYDKCKLDTTIKLNVCHFFDLVTKLDLTRRLPKRSNVPDFDDGIRRGLPGLHYADNEKVLPGLHHSSRSTFLKILGLNHPLVF